MWHLPMTGCVVPRGSRGQRTSEGALRQQAGNRDLPNCRCTLGSHTAKLSLRIPQEWK